MTKRTVLSGLLLVILALAPGSSRALAQATQESNLLAAVQNHPQDVGSYLDLAKYYITANRYDDAQAQMTKAMSLLRDLRAQAALPAAGPGRMDAPVRVGGAIPTPRCVKYVDPAYPPVARQAKVSGVVILEVRISGEGKVVDAHVLRSIPLLDQAALDAVLQWEYTPTVVDGRAVPVIMTVTVTFVST